MKFFIFRKNLEFQLKEVKENLEKESRAKVDAVRAKKLAEDQAIEYETQLDEAKMVLMTSTLLCKKINNSKMYKANYSTKLWDTNEMNIEELLMTFSLLKFVLKHQKQIS